MNINIEIVFLDLLKNDFLDLRGLWLDGSIMFMFYYFVLKSYHTI